LLLKWLNNHAERGYTSSGQDGKIPVPGRRDAMKRAMFGWTILAFALAAAAQAEAQSGVASAFEKLKSLAGEWSGTAKGQPVTVSYRVVSNGSAIEETLQATPTETMITIYHLDLK
jgi:hypothetical protein